MNRIIVKLPVVIVPYHDGEDVAVHRLMVQRFSGVQNACSRVQFELPQAEGIGAAQQRKGQFVLLVSVHGADLQHLGPGRRVFGDAHFVLGLRELRPVVVGVDDTDEHLRRSQEQNRSRMFYSPPDSKVIFQIRTRLFS